MLTQNVIANFVGQGWRAIVNLAFIPIYIKYLGAEAYGLIGFYAVLQVTLGLIENGLTPALGREMARFQGGAYDLVQVRNLLRTFEILILGIAIFSFIFVGSVAGWISTNWLDPEQIPTHVVEQCIVIMGLILGLKFLENIYNASLQGMQDQVVQNAIITTMATCRGVGAVVLVVFISPSITAFFLWQAFISFLTVLILMFAVYRKLPSTNIRAHFSISAVREVSSFVGGMIALTTLSVLLTQFDKLLLPKFVSLASYGHYTFAFVVASATLMFSSPIIRAFYPRLIESLTKDDTPNMIFTYHLGTQLNTVLIGSICILLFFFSNQVLLSWTGDNELTRVVAPLLQIMVCGTLTIGLISFPNHFQLANGWTSLRVRTDLVTVFFYVPLFLFLVPAVGVKGAALFWAGLHLCRLFLIVPLMHKRLIKSEQKTWWVYDVILPLFCMLLVALVLQRVVPGTGSRTLGVMYLGVSAVILISIGVLSSNLLRRVAISYTLRVYNRLVTSLPV